MSTSLAPGRPLGQTPPSRSRPGPGCVLWLTGPPCSGKSALAQALRTDLARMAVTADVVDGDEFRAAMGGDLSYSATDRELNARRMAYVAQMLARNGLVAIVAAITPYACTRLALRRSFAEAGVLFLEVHVDAPLDVLIKRDVKGHYRRALAGDLPGFTGVGSPYEPPEHPDLAIHTHLETLAEGVHRLRNLLNHHGVIVAAADERRA